MRNESPSEQRATVTFLLLKLSTAPQGLLTSDPRPRPCLAQPDICWGLAGKAKGCSEERPHSLPSRAWAVGKPCTAADPKLLQPGPAGSGGSGGARAARIGALC